MNTYHELLFRVDRVTHDVQRNKACVRNWNAYVSSVLMQFYSSRYQSLPGPEVIKCFVILHSLSYQ